MLRADVERPAALGVPLALALEVAEELADLPWELLRLPAPPAPEGGTGTVGPAARP